MNRFRFPLIAAFLSALVLTTQAEVEEEYWARLFFGGQPVGHLHSRTEKLSLAGEPVYKVTQSMAMTFSRAGTTLDVSYESKILEAADGTIRNFSTSMRVGPQSLLSQGSVRDGVIHLKNEQGSHEIPYPAGAVGSRAFDRALRAPGLTVGATGQMLTFDADNPAEAIQVSWKVLPPESKEALGTIYQTVPITLSYSRFPGMNVKIWTDTDARFIAGQIPLGGLGLLEMVRAPREVALGHVQPAEVFTTSLITPDQPIPHAAQLTRATFRLKTPPEITLSLPNGVGQTILKQEPGLIELRVEMPTEPDPALVWNLPLPPSETLAPMLAANRYLDWQDPNVQTLAKEIRGAETNALAIARRIQDEVYRRIGHKNLATGFARASDVARTLSGDCTEHAVLAAAIARASGLPARVVSGLVHAPDPSRKSAQGVFGFHMWAEVMVAPDTWWPIDPAFNRFDPTHIAFTRSSLDGMNPEVDLAIPILDAIGRIQLEVIAEHP
ncbi:MAG: hypothetical protein OHK005_07360 [Candidatus Methylacidiphilales bacterium]